MKETRRKIGLEPWPRREEELPGPLRLRPAWEPEIDRLKAELAAMHQRAERAEAKVAVMREALEQVQRSLGAVLDYDNHSHTAEWEDKRYEPHMALRMGLDALSGTAGQGLLDRVEAAEAVVDVARRRMVMIAERTAIKASGKSFSMVLIENDDEMRDALAALGEEGSDG